MRRRMSEAFDIRHRRALFQSFTVVSHCIERFLGPSRTGGFARNDKECALFCRMQRVWQCLIAAAFAAASCGPQAAPVSDFTGERYQMVQEQLKARGVSDQRVLAAMKKVRRDEIG